MFEQKSKNELFQNIFYIIVYIFIIIVAIYVVTNFINNDPNNKYIKSIQVSGYKLDKKFSENEYYYTVMVDSDEVKVVCDTQYETKGCNETINLNGKQSYQHEIILMAENSKTKYILNIYREQVIVDSTQTTKPEQTTNQESVSTQKQNKELKIISIKGNPKEWTNKDVKIEVNASSTNGIDSYSFDGGLTWQKENYKTISQNTTLKIMVKDKTGITTSSEEVKITKIDKEKPKVQLIKSSATTKEVVLAINATDILSGVEKISFNGGSFTKAKTYKARKTGVYSVKVKDAAGNVSEEATINIEKNDFAQNRGETKKTFTLTFDSNGATINQNSISCTTAGNSCEVTLPIITRNGAVIHGWSTTANSKSAEYKSGQQITISKNQTLYAITAKTFTATFNANGASSIGSNSLSCAAYNKNTSCSVKMPSITRSGGSVIGWNRTSNATKPSMVVGETLTLNSNITYYAITYKTLTATFNKKEDSEAILSRSSDSCTVYNRNTSCSVTLPYVTRTGKTIMGFYKYGQNRDYPPYLPAQTVSINSNTTFYVRTGTVRGLGRVRKPAGTTQITGIKNAPNGIIVIEYDNECRGSVNSFANALKRIYNNAPYLFRIHKVFLLNDSNFAFSYYESPKSSGLQHGIPQAQAIDLRCSYFQTEKQRESVLVHELAHAMDGYYQIQNSSKRLMNQDFQNVYQNYCKKSIFRSYAATNLQECFAESYLYYYYTYISKTDNYYYLSNYPSAVKTKLESYIKIAKSRW